MDQTSIKVKGAWKYRYRAVDKEGCAVTFLSDGQTGQGRSPAFFEKAMKASGVPEKVASPQTG